MQPPRFGAAIGDDVHAKLSPRRLDGLVDLSFGDLEAGGEDLEVVDERLHRLVDPLPRRRGHLAVGRPVVARRHGLHDLFDDVQRLAHLFHTHDVPVEGVPVLSDRYLELILLDAAVREDLANVVVETGGPGVRAGYAIGTRFGRGDHTDALGAVDEYRVLVEQRLVIGEAGADSVDDVLDVGLPSLRQVGGNSSRPDVVVVHSEARDPLEELEDHLSLSPAVEHDRQRSDVEPEGGQPEEVAGHPIELGHQDPDRLGTVRYVDVEQLFGCQGETQLIVEWGQVVHAGDVGAALHEGEGFSGLLHAGVEVADDGLDPPDRLTLQLDLEPQDTVGRRVLRAHVEHLALLLVEAGLLGVVVDDGHAALGSQGRIEIVRKQLLGALVGGGRHPVRLLGACHPHVVDPTPFFCSKGAALFGALRIGGLRSIPVLLLTVACRLLILGVVAHRVALNSTGMAPTRKSLRSGWPSHSSGMSSRVRSGWPSKTIPNMSQVSRS